MKNELTPRLLIIGLVLLWGLWSVWPTYKFQNLTEEQKISLSNEGQLDELEQKTIKQGLDLKGGMYIVLEVDLPTLVENLATNKDNKFSNAIAKTKNDLKKNPEADFYNLFLTATNDYKLKLTRYFYDYGSNNNLILDAIKIESEDAIDRVLEILQNRIDQFGVAEPTIQKQGNQRIIVELAGVQNSERARALLESTALLEFYIVKQVTSTNEVMIKIDNILKGDKDLLTELKSSSSEIKDTMAPNSSNDETVSIGDLFEQPKEELSNESDSLSNSQENDISIDRPFSSLLRNLGNSIGVPNNNIFAVKNILKRDDVRSQLASIGGEFLFGHKAEEYGMNNGATEEMTTLYLVEDQAELTGGVVEDAKANLGPQGSTSAGQPIVNLSMGSDGGRKWAIVTGSNVGRQVAIVLDKKVHMAPNIREKISGGGTLIEGFANIDEAKDIAIVLRAGALPAPVDIIEERVIGPSLGADSVRMGTFSVIIGLVAVLIFMLIYYKLSGLIADFALIWNIILVLAVLASLNATLTLPGIAGLILTVGMSIDSNVIIFERIREELKKGKGPKAAIDGGYQRALTTIIDANMTTLIAALVLWQFGTGPIKGFSTVLFWGILISMFTSIFVTRTIFNFFTNKQKLSKLSI